MTSLDDDSRDRFLTLAEAQAGSIASRQIRAAGLTAKQVNGLIRRGWLRRTAARGVYRIAGAERSPKQDLWVAMLAGPPGTLASHLSAASLHGLVAPPVVPHVTVPRWASGQFGGAEVHHARVGAVDRGRCDGVEATTVGRTIVDCAAVLGQTSLNGLVDAAFGKGLCTHPRVLDAWARAGRVRGGKLLEAGLAPYSGGARPGSVAAAHVLRRIHDWGLPMPLCEQEIRDRHGGFVARVDFIWPPWWLILEYDGDAHHGPRRWAVDHAVQAELEVLGYRVERADRFDLRPSSTRLFDRLSDVLLQPPVGPWPYDGPRSRRAA
ncbi:MAG TPA: type IV toxin-antitoxin system AbiEi family antitoxin domain-containing protein [Acidimicrobiia bacterium]|nr:type IV toxin-antitoxin system AbiEi family antitoxin domain-containing protein [Acidimicrobiia bacterium]